MKLFGFHILSSEDYDVLSGEIGRLDSILRDRGELINSLNSGIASWQAKCDEREDEITSLKYELSELKDLYAERETECQMLKEQVNEVVSAGKKWADEATRLQHSNQELTKDNDTIYHVLESQKKRLNEANRALENCEGWAEKYKRELKPAEANVREHKRQLKRQDEELKTLRDFKAKIEAQIERKNEARRIRRANGKKN